MVYVNSKKFACESCIKGHRSSSCHHTDRPLFEIKKKGRPVSQCTKCRELRQSKKFHSKCTCNHGVEVQAVQPLASSSTSKTRRFIPIVPALPNGLKDVLIASQTPMQPSDSRQRVDSLLNPCDCKSLWKCKCKESINPTPSGSIPPSSDCTDGLNALASAAAAIRYCSPSSSSMAAPSSPSLQDANSRKYSHRTRSPPGSPASHLCSKNRPRHSPFSQPPGPDLAPLLYRYSPSSSSISAPMPEFESMPPMSEISSLAGSGCTCGLKCACPGCVEHRAATETARERTDCADGCGTCIDSSIGAALPDLSGDSQGSSVSFLDRFFARAAALPPPPMHRRMSFDPMDTTVYSPGTGSQPFGFGSVNLPKLECCGGQCQCPSEQCTCHNSCAGCCADSTHGEQSSEATGFEYSLQTSSVPGSCCT